MAYTENLITIEQQVSNHLLLFIYFLANINAKSYICKRKGE